MKSMTRTATGQAIDIGFELPNDTAETVNYGGAVQVYVAKGSNFLHITSDADESLDHVIVNTGQLDSLIGALTKIRDHHAARPNSGETPAPAIPKHTADQAYHNIVGGETADLSAISANHAWTFVDRVITQISSKNPAYDPAHKARAANALLASMIAASAGDSPAAGTWKDGVGACAQRLLGLKVLKLSEIDEPNILVIENQLAAAFG